MSAETASPRYELTPTALIAVRIKTELMLRRMKQHELAVKLGWTGMYLSRRLAGQVQMGIEDLFAIAGALDMSVHELLDLAESATKPRLADADGASGVATGRVELPTFRFSVERSTS